MKLSYILFVFLLSFNAFSKEISIKIFSQDKVLTPNLVVALTPKVASEYVPPKDLAIMDQVDTQFLPHILIVQRGTEVIFPNSDSIKHHVYSFSSAKTFELQLYKDLQAEPLLFEDPGVVELGCNIHDWMLGYIFVTDSPYFGKTDENGEVSLDVPDGDYKVQVWSPRFQESTDVMELNISVPKQNVLDVHLTHALDPELDLYEQSVDDFSDY